MEPRDASAMAMTATATAAGPSSMDSAPDGGAVEASAPPAATAQDEEAGESLCEKKFFDERAEVAVLLQRLVNAQLSTPESDVDAAFLKDHEAITQILDRYLEQSHLLDPFLHEMVDPVVSEIKRVMLQRVVSTPDTVTAFPFQVYRNPKLHKLFQVLYHLCRVRGYKTIVKVLPHEVADFEPTLHLLQSQDRADHSAWETRYVLLLWLSMLCLVPFDLSTIDSSGASNSSNSTSIVASIVTLCKDYLGDPGATQVAAAVCLSRLLSRPDMERHHLTQFLTWANAELQRAATSEEPPRASQFRVTGVMLCLSHIAKHSPRAQHVEASRIYFSSVMQLIARLTDEDAASSSTLHRKLSVKLVQRLGLLYLPPRVRAWRYRRGLRSLEMNFQSLGLVKDTITLGSSPQVEDNKEEDEDDVDSDVLEELEQIVEVLLCGLRDKDTIVRWSAAKGIGRITGRLPYAFADDIVQSVLELFVATEGDGAWHGASLALAELARRGVLLPQRLSDAVQCVTSALQYDIRRTTHSIGAHVRDAACYACWSFARAYEPSLLLPWLTQSLAPAMLVNCVFDRELNCRRAASAAFQENVGRQGRANFPHGIELLTRADYFSVSNLRHAYLDVSSFVARFPEYRYHLMDHLVARKISHWDATIRSLAASALGRIGSLDPEYSMAHVLPHLLVSAVSSDVEVIERHGAVLATSQLFMALAQRPAFLGGELLRSIKMLPIDIEKRRLFRGRGGELIRSAVCNLMEVIASAHLSLSFAHVKKYLVILEECMVHATEGVRESAISAFQAFTAQYCATILDKAKNPAHVKLVKEIIPRFVRRGIAIPVKGDGATASSVLNPNVAARRGYLRAVGVADKALVQPKASECVLVLLRALSLKQQVSDEEDAESRVAAVRALVDLCVRYVGVDSSVSTQLELDADLEDAVVEALVDSVTLDYRIDERGDVGSWIRKEAMLGLEKLLRGPTKREQREASMSVGLVGTQVDSEYGRGVIVGCVTLPAHMRPSSLATDSLTGFGSDDEADEDAEGDVGADPLCLVQFVKPTLGAFHFGSTGTGHIHLRKLRLLNSDRGSSADAFEFPDSVERARVALELQSQALKATSRAPKRFGSRLSPDLVGKVMAAIAQQLAEKLDGVRATAGAVLFRLLHSTSPRVTGIPDRSDLETRVFPRSLVVNWSMAHDTFPLVVMMMELPPYLEAVTAGLVLSVGGLTESVVKASKAAMFDWIRGHTQAKNFGLLRRFAFFLVALLARHQGDDRVTIPVMKTLATLLESNLLRFLFDEGQRETPSSSQPTTPSEFGSRLYDALRDEIQKCTAVPKLSAGIAVLVGLLPSDSQTQERTLKALLLFLAHRFPKVRKLTAERLYTRLLVYEELVDEDKYDVVLEKLSDTAWDAPIVQVREARDELLDLLDMERPQKKKQRVDGDGGR